MQKASNALRNQLWDKLAVIFNKYANPKTKEIDNSVVEEIVRDVLGETTKMEIDYVIKNMFKLDADYSGTVSLREFGNFLFKRHCGQMSLQKMHRANILVNGSQRKILLDEFFTLLNNAYAFLGVSCTRELAAQIFNDADKDKDGLITYVQYFQVIDKYVCQTSAQFSQYANIPEKKKQEPVSKPKPKNQRQWNSRLRLFLWSQLKKLYNAYVANRNLSLNDQELRALIISILGNISQMQMVFLLNGLFQIDTSYIQFLPFAMVFLYLVGQLGLSNFKKNHAASKKSLTLEEFIILFNNTYKFLGVSKIKRFLFEILFRKLVLGTSNSLEFGDYLAWIKRYIAVSINLGDHPYCTEDDASLNKGQIFEETPAIKPITPATTGEYKRNAMVRFKFTSYELAEIVRARILELLIPYDTNSNRILEENEIVDALVGILGENELQLLYVTRNVFRYDRNNTGRVTFNQFTNFCVEQHFGEMAIQRLHREHRYSRERERMMNEKQFAFTLEYALEKINLKARSQTLKDLFKIINLKGDGWITYEVYFTFLREYFGSLSPIFMVKQTLDIHHHANRLTAEEQYIGSLSELSPLARFIRIIVDQLKKIFFQYDFDKNLKFSMDEIQAILRNVFGLEESEVNYVLFTFFRMETRKNSELQFDELVNILLQVYFVEILIKRKYSNISPSEWRNKKLNLEEFIEMILKACFFLRLKPLRGDLVIVFNMLDTNHDHLITFEEYFDFIRNYLCNGYELPDAEEKKQISMKHIDKDHSPERHKNVPSNVTGQEWAFIKDIWNQLKEYFDSYDIGKKGYLKDAEFKAFVMEILHQTSQNELDYIFWNMSRVDINANGKTQFQQFAPFILNHSGEIALQRFHKQQIKGKNSLTHDELSVTFNNAYNFLKTIPKSKKAIEMIYKRIGGGSEVKYGAYLTWINRALSRKFH